MGAQSEPANACEEPEVFSLSADQREEIVRALAEADARLLASDADVESMFDELRLAYASS